MSDWLIYGANGYSAQLAAERAIRFGMRPVIGGRNEAAVQAVAQRLGLDWLGSSLDDIDVLTSKLRGFKVVAHCAGPFAHTARPMMKAAIRAGVHYVDITGEIPVFELGQELDGEARAAGVVLCPGVGFDVIPTDCVAACLKQALPDATQLCLAFAGDSALSRGTAKTSIEGLARGFLIRENGKFKKVSRAFAHRTIDFGRGEQPVAIIPWGDVSTAYWTTGIPNIRVYLPYKGGVGSLYMTDVMRPLLALPPVQKFLKAGVDKRALKQLGPDEARRAARPTVVWGEVTNARGERRTARLTTAHGYSVTAEGIVTAVANLLKRGTSNGGYFTPSQLLGERVIESFEGSGKIEIV